MDYGESEEVQKVHAAIQREKQEPRVGLEPLSLWLIGVYSLALFFGGAYLGRYSGGFSGDSLDPGGVPTAKKAAGPGGGQQQAARQESFRGKLCGLPPGKRARIAKPGLSAAGRF